MRRSWFTAAVELVKAGLRQWRTPGKVLRAVRVLLSRRQEEQQAPDANGEVVCVAVRPAYLQPKFARTTGLRASEELVCYAGRELARERVAGMRMLVDADNKPVLFLYHRLGARFEPYEQAGEPMVQVWFDLTASVSIAG
jgi:ribosomal protein S18 acetylase RimI-like enzyme